jgi:AhpD family alkylhydroperoxidase
LRPVAASGVRWLAPVRITDAVFAEMRREFVVGAPITLHAADPGLLAAVWAALRETLIAGPAERAAREAVGTTVSRINACPYCVDAHAMMLSGAGEHELAKEAGGETEVRSPIVRWAAATAMADAPELARPPFAETDAAQIIGTAVFFHYINRLVNVFIGPSPFPGLAPPWLKRLLGAMTASRIVSVEAAPCEDAARPDLPPDLAWTASNPAVAHAFTGLAAATDAAGGYALPGAARAALRAEIEDWRGGASSPAPADEPPIVRLARVAAFASWRVDGDLISACRGEGADDRALLGAAAWASFTAARRISAWTAVASRGV